ncbi:MAG: hypothetical protein JO061_15450, partial [Acidobacteriaceae bacterium]|nr:hypothetical protein [Acidobacteriaceae bacterium]
YRAFLLLVLPFEILAEGLSGRAYFHYLAPLVPSLCLLCGIGIVWVQRRIESSPVVTQAAVILLLCAFAGLEVRRFLFFRLLYLRTDPTAVAVAAFIDRTTSSHDYIQPIGDGAADAIALRSRRHPASEFIYQLPMVHRVNAQRESQLHRFLTTLSQKEPSVIFSVPSAIGSLCASDFIGYRNIAARDGYEYGQLRRALEPELKGRYTLIRDPAFGPDCVYLRNDIAQSMLGRPKSSP